MTREKYKTFMRENVFGIPEPLIHSIGKRIELFNDGLSRDKQPVGAFLLTGDPGVGKTLAAYATAEFLHGNPNAVLHIAGEQYKHSHEVAKLKGAPPGYLGHRETTPLFTQAKLNSITTEESKLSIIVIDEIDKAHESFSELFLDALQSARWTLGDNSVVNFERCIFFFTANWGSERRKSSEKWGFIKKPDSTATANDVRSGIHPAFMDRIKSLGGIHEFSPMNDDVRGKIIGKTLRESERFLMERKRIRVTLTMCEELHSECMANDSGRLVAAKVKEFVDEMLLANKDLIIKTSGNSKDLSKNISWEILKDFDVKQVVTRAKGAYVGEGV